MIQLRKGEIASTSNLNTNQARGNRAAFVCTLQNYEVKLSFMRRSPNMLTYQELTLTDAFFFFSHRSKTFLYALDCQRWSAVPDCWKCSGPWLPIFFSPTRIRYFRYFFSIFFSQYLSAPLASYDARGALGHVRAHKATKRQEEIWVCYEYVFLDIIQSHFCLFPSTCLPGLVKFWMCPLLLLKVLFAAARRHDICQKL